MTRRQVIPTRYSAGPYRLVRIRRRAGYAIRDERTGRYAYTEPHPVSGRPIAALVSSAREALAIARTL